MASGKRALGIGTLCVQAGYNPGKGDPRQIPIVQSTTFKYETSDQMGRLFDLEDSGYFYTRLQNPTNDMVAAQIAALEGGVAAMLTSSGQAANLFACLNICSGTGLPDVAFTAAHAAALVGAEGQDRLAGEIKGFQEG